MRSELECRSARESLSARIDGEADAKQTASLESHLETCADCRLYEQRLWMVRRGIRMQLAEPVPDLSDRIVARLETASTQMHRSQQRRERLRYAVLGAAASALLLLATSLPLTNRTVDTASASEIVSGIRAAAREVASYRATFSIVERGWHPAIPVRRFSARVSYSAPEKIALVVKDQTRYPSQGWPRNDVSLVSDGKSWWIEEPTTCPVAALPGCAAGQPERRALHHRPPFDGIAPVPTEMILPLISIGSADGLTVRRSDVVMGRDADVVVLSYRQAAPLIETFQAAGAWRAFHPSDEVTVWIDRATSFPLRIEIRRGDSLERSEWAVRNSYLDPPEQVLFAMTATSLSLSVPRASVFRMPRSPLARSGGFREVGFDRIDERFVPRDLAGLAPYRAGYLGDRTVLSWSRGVTFVKLVTSRSSRAAPERLSAEEVDLPGVGPAYYEPASEYSPRHLDIYTDDAFLRLDGNLPRADLIRFASSIPVVARRSPSSVTTASGAVIRRLDEADASEVPFALRPSFLPAGYRLSAALLTQRPKGRATLTVYYRRLEAEFGGFGIRITQSSPADVLAPTAEVLIATPIGTGVVGRWSTDRAELEWIEDGIYRAVAAPSFGREVALEIARRLR